MGVFYNLFEEIADYIIKQVQTMSLESGFQLEVGYEEIEQKFKLPMSDDNLDNITYCLDLREEVADLEITDTGFDIVIFTSYAPNYDPEDYY